MMLSPTADGSDRLLDHRRRHHRQEADPQQELGPLRRLFRVPVCDDCAGHASAGRWDAGTCLAGGDWRGRCRLHRHEVQPDLAANVDLYYATAASSWIDHGQRRVHELLAERRWYLI